MIRQSSLTHSGTRKEVKVRTRRRMGIGGRRIKSYTHPEIGSLVIGLGRSQGRGPKAALRLPACCAHMVRACFLCGNIMRSVPVVASLPSLYILHWEGVGQLLYITSPLPFVNQCLGSLPSLQVDKDSDSKLFWGLRGAGAFPVHTVCACTLCQWRCQH